MPSTVLLCTDGSDLARAALARGMAVIAPTERAVLATVIEAIDATLVTGTGFAGGVMSGEELDHDYRSRTAAAQAMLDAARDVLGRPDAETVVLAGAAGPVLCDLAGSLPASVVVIGTRGHGGLRRAVLGSVSDHVVRHAPCPVLTVGEA